MGNWLQTIARGPRSGRDVERRAIQSVPWDVGGVSPSHVSQDRALTLGPVYAAVRHIGDSISTLPLHGYRRADDQRLPMGSLPVLFRQLEQAGDLIDWLYQCLSSLALRGSAVGLVTGFDGFGFPSSVSWSPMDEIHVDESELSPVWYWRGRRLGDDEFVHIPWVTMPGRALGLSPIEFYATVITSGIEAQRYGLDWFLAGGVPSGTFKNSQQTVDQVQADVIKGRLVSAIRTHKPIVYGADWEYNAISIPPEQAQFVEATKLTATEIAAIYGIAPEELGGEAANSLTYTNEEMRQITRMSNLRPWVQRLERKFTSWLPEAQYVRFNMDATIRPDTKGLHEVFEIGRRIGLYNVDELRALVDRPPLPNGEGEDYTPLGKSSPAPAEVLLPPRTNGDRSPTPVPVS